MTRQFRPVLVATGSCLLGLVVGIGAQIIHVRDFERAQRETIAEFESRGQSPPQLIDLLKPAAYPTLFSAGFGVAGMLLYLAYYLVASRSSHET